jgi:hypothetical protein
VEAVADAWPQDLDRDFRAVLQFCAMDLRDRGRCDGRTELLENSLDRAAMRRFDRGLRLSHREWLHPVLQGREVGGDLHADDIGPRRQELAELDIGRPEPRQRRSEPRRRGAGTRPLDQAPEPDQPARQRRQYGGLDQRKRALARQHEADAGGAGEVKTEEIMRA